MALLEVKSLSAGYDKPIFADISFSAEAGEVTGILGRNGCGKTTLLRGIAGSLRRFAGEIWVDGKNCTVLSVKQQARLLSVLPQQTQVLEGIRVEDLMKMGRYPYAGLFSSVPAGERVAECAEKLGISHLLDMDCAKLSQGQRQLVLLGRCLVQDTPVLLLDEPNSALDYDNTHAMFGAVKGLAAEGGKAALLVLHDPELALKYCDRVLILKDGRLRATVFPQTASSQEVEAALELLYPNVKVRKDSHDGSFRCYTQTIRARRECLC